MSPVRSISPRPLGDPCDSPAVSVRGRFVPIHSCVVGPARTRPRIRDWLTGLVAGAWRGRAENPPGDGGHGCGERHLLAGWCAAGPRGPRRRRARRPPRTGRAPSSSGTGRPRRASWQSRAAQGPSHEQGCRGCGRVRFRAVNSEFQNGLSGEAAAPSPRERQVGDLSGAPAGYRWSVGGCRFSLSVRGAVQRSRFSGEPALSWVPEARAPPNGCWPTTAPVGLSLT